MPPFSLMPEPQSRRSRQQLGDSNERYCVRGRREIRGGEGRDVRDRRAQREGAVAAPAAATLRQGLLGFLKF
ncbi:hypothetical protein V6Z12_D09G007300 [Gossypium hirsutum]